MTVREDVHVDLKIPIAAALCESVKLGPYLEGFFFLRERDGYIWIFRLSKDDLKILRLSNYS